MLFSPLQKAYFDATEGAYSIVTEREHKDRQITLTDKDGEKPIAYKHFGEENIPRERSPLPMSVWFSANELIHSHVNLRYPKNEKNELRIYASEDSRFQFNAGACLIHLSQRGQSRSRQHARTTMESDRHPRR